MQICQACGVKIDGDVVLFSYGKPGTRDRLYTRVCQFAKKPGCINQGASVNDADQYDTQLIVKE